MHLTETPRPLHEIIPEVPVHVEAAIARALSRARDDRFDSIAAFVAALRASAGGATLVVDSPGPSARQPASVAEARVKRTAVLPTSTTFSRATGELGLEDSDESLMRAKRYRRWPVFAVGGAAVVAFMSFLLARLSREPALDATTHPESNVVSPTPARQALTAVPATVAPAPTVLPGKSDAGIVLPSTIRTPPATMQERTTAPGTNSPAAAKKKTKRSEDDEWIGH
jgi:hypothetical protein